MSNIESDETTNNLISTKQIEILDSLFLDTQITTDEDLAALAETFDEDE